MSRGDELREFMQLREEAKKIQRDLDRAQGALEQNLASIKEEFGCKSLLEAESLLKKLRRGQRKAEQKFAVLFARFKKKWQGVLE